LVDWLIGRIAAGLAGLRSLSSLVRGALGAVSRRLCGLGSAGSSIGSSLGGSSILHCLVGRCLDLIDGFLRNATARSNQDESNNACLQRGGDGVLHDFFPLLLGRTKLDESD